MVLLKNLFHGSSPFNSAREENGVQHAGIICSCSHHSSTGWHPGHLQVPQCCCWVPTCGLRCPPAHTETPQAAVDTPSMDQTLQAHSCMFLGQEGKALCSLASSLAQSLRQPITSIKPIEWEHCFFPAPAGIRSGCGGGIPLAPPEGDLCHFYCVITHTSNDEHL